MAAERAIVPDHADRVVVLGDPHGDLVGVESVFRIEDDGGAFFCCVGDVVGYADGPASSRLCRFLMEKRTLTVEGNHEEWVSPRGKLAVFQGHDSRLDADVLGWVRSLPKLVRLTRSNGDPLTVLAHSIRRGGWDWIDEGNAAQFAEDLGSPPVVLVGHSHRPKFFSVGAGGRVNRQSFDYCRNESLERPIPKEGTLLVDAGSVARPEAVEFTGSRSRHDGARFGTYAVLDLATGSASLKRILKDE